MSEVNNDDPLEKFIHQTLHDLADKYGVDVDTVAQIVSDYRDAIEANLVNFN